jgi:hypothetical protein
LDKVKQSYGNLKKAIDDYTEAGTKLAKNEKTI